MQHHHKAWGAGIAVICTVALGGALSAQGQDNATPRKAEPGAVVVAHGLAMAIEGSTLQGLALQAGGAVAPAAIPVSRSAVRTAPPAPSGSTATARLPRAGEAGTGITGTPAGSTGSGLDTFGRDPRTTATRETGTPGGLATPRAGQAGTGTARSPAGSAGSGLSTFGRDPEGTIVPGTAYSTSSGGVPRTVLPRATVANAAPPVAAPVNEVPDRRAMIVGSASADELMQRSWRAFAASESLLRQPQTENGPTERFYKAANRYATTLRTLGGMPAARGAALASKVVEPVSGIDLGSVALVNHSLKEALESLQLRQMIRTMGADSAAGRALMDRARQMDAESRQAIHALALIGGPVTAPAKPAALAADVRSDETRLRDGSFINPSAGSVAAVDQGVVPVVENGRGATVQLLVQQARDVLQSIRELEGNSR